MRIALILAALPFGGAAQEAELQIEHFHQREGFNAAAFRAKADGALKVQVGGSIARSPIRSTSGIRDLVECGGADAVAVGYEDLAAEPRTARALLESPESPFLCANVKGIGRSHVVRQVGTWRVAFVAVTWVPSHMTAPEGLREWTLEDPATRLKALLPELATSADVVVLLAVMDRIECGRLLKEVPGIQVALVRELGGNDPQPIRIGGSWLVQTPAGSGTLARLMLRREAGKTVAASNALEAVSLSPKDRERLGSILSSQAGGFDVGRLGVQPGEPVPAEKSGPLTALEAGKDLPFAVLRSNPSVEIRMESLRVSDEREGRKAPDGSAWLSVRSAWKNLIPLTASGNRSLPTAYSVGDAGNNLYLVVNGKRLSRLEAELSTGPRGLLTGRAISIAALGEVRRGDLVFPLPASGVETLELQFHDFRGPPVTFPLLARPGGTAEETPRFPPVKNEIFEAAVFRVERGKDGDAVVDLRVRSLVTVELEGRRVGVPGDLESPWDRLRLVADGKEIEPRAGLPATPRVLPGAMTGWDLQFPWPESAASLELRWSFPDIGTPDGRIVKPAPLRISLSGPAARGCPKCAEPAASSDKFCAKCGTKL